MRGWIQLCSDINWVDYHGMWARKARDGSWYVLEWTNLFDAGGSEFADTPYECQVKRLDLRDLSEKDRKNALRSCGQPDDSGELQELEACIEYGFGAPLESVMGAKYPKRIRAQARRYAERCIKDAVFLEERMERPVNKIGSTAREYGLGDINSAMFRGDSTAHKILRKMHGFSE